MAMPADVAEWLCARVPRLAAVDSPRSPARAGEKSRAGERELVHEGACQIRWTPDREGLARNPAYYEWIVNGLELYEQLDAVGIEVIECFPTASWTRWAGARGRLLRSKWSQRALEAIDLTLPTRRLSQDERDAIGAALTARAHSRGETESFGAIVVHASDRRSRTTSLRQRGRRTALAEGL
jgi:predicted nuclease with RNAse H fold